MQIDVLDTLVYLARHGSHAYGLARAESDLDIKGILIAPTDVFLGYTTNFEQAINNADLQTFLNCGEIDSVVYGLQKFFKLAADCNPNIIELLWVDASDLLLHSIAGKRIREHRDLFLSLKAKHTFSGYAHAQLKRIQTHRRWLLDPPKGCPQRVDFGLPDEKLVSGDALGTVKTLEDGGHSFSAELMEAIKKEKAYAAALAQWKQYENWKKMRNPKRAALEAKYGYDCYLADTEFLTDSGWKRFDEISTVHQLGTLNQQTGRIEFQHFTDRVAKQYSGRIGVLTPQHSNCAVTLNHRMWVSPAHRSEANGYSWGYAPETAQWMITPLHQLARARRSYFHTRLAGEPLKNDFEGVSREYLVLMGAYIAEGCVGKRLQDGSASVLRISQEVGGKLCEWMDPLHNRFSEHIRAFEYLRDESSRTHPCYERIWTVSNRAWAHKLANECGCTSLDKRLPPWVLQLSRHQVILLLKVLLAGDGSPHGDGWVYYTASKRLADDIQTMCVSSGIVSAIWGPYPNRDYADMYHVFIDFERDRFATAVVRNEDTQSCTFQDVRDVRIVCFTVPNEVLVTRRNGKIAIHGNTKHAMHLIRLMRMCVEILSGLGVIVKRRYDREELNAVRDGKWSYDQLMLTAEALEEEADRLYKSNPAGLPKGANHKKLNALCVELQQSHVCR